MHLSSARLSAAAMAAATAGTVLEDVDDDEAGPEANSCCGTSWTEADGSSAASLSMSAFWRCDASRCCSTNLWSSRSSCISTGEAAAVVDGRCCTSANGDCCKVRVSSSAATAPPLTIHSSVAALPISRRRQHRSEARRLAYVRAEPRQQPELVEFVAVGLGECDE